VTLVFTCGDPLSINVEAFLKAVVPSMSRHRTVLGIGSLWQLQNQADQLSVKLPTMKVIKSFDRLDQSGVHWIDSSPKAPEVDARELNDEQRGKMSVEALNIVPKSLPGSFAVLTAPINKYSASKAGFTYPGQTEFFENLWGSKAVMMLAGPSLRVALATNHVALKDVSPRLTSNLLIQKLKIIHQAMPRLFNIKNPRIAVCGLNPHCGDRGLFGDEEERIISPAIIEGQSLGLQITGPLPADTCFFRAMRGEFDVVLAMYHDQGLGPLKTVHFDEAVNISLGLPHLRVSPDHGPAADEFLTGKASMRSFDVALKVCERWLGG
jgi:4-hydroxythreonine-4-phosphate dehydrogenase